jgi:hypothetical protein
LPASSSERASTLSSPIGRCASSIEAGAAWFLNSRAIELLGLDRGEHTEGVERDERGRATGRLFRCDAWLGARLLDAAPPTLASVSRRLAGYGVTGVTDATVHNGRAQMDAFVDAAAGGSLLQRVHVMGTQQLADRAAAA